MESRSYDLLENFKIAFIKHKENAALYFDKALNDAKIDLEKNNKLDVQFSKLKKSDENLYKIKNKIFSRIKLSLVIGSSFLLFLFLMMEYFIFYFKGNFNVLIVAPVIFLLSLIIFLVSIGILYIRYTNNYVDLTNNKIDENIIAYNNKLLLVNLIISLNDNSELKLINKTDNNIIFFDDPNESNDIFESNSKLDYISKDSKNVYYGKLYNNSFLLSKENYNAQIKKNEYAKKIIKSKFKLLVEFDYLNNLVFEREKSSNNDLSLKEQDVLYNLEKNWLSKMSENTKDITFTQLEDELFETLFESYNRSDEISYRMLFSPITRKNYIDMFKKTSLSYGDIYDIKKLDKYFLIDIYFPTDLNLDYDFSFPDIVNIKKIKTEFVKSQLSYFRIFYFIIAPLLAIPDFVKYKFR